MAVAVLTQLVDTQFMAVPLPEERASESELAVFTLHEYVGLTTFVIVVLFWLSLLRQPFRGDRGALFPWFSRSRLAALRADIATHFQAARRLTLPDPDRSLALAPAVQGLGLLIVLAMGLTGLTGFLTWAPGTDMRGTSAVAFTIHEIVANGVWAFVIVHVGATLLHELLGHRLLRRVSPLPD